MIKQFENEIERLRTLEPKSHNTHKTLLNLLGNYTWLKNKYQPFHKKKYNPKLTLIQ
jgi:hypothetical protein